MTHALAPMRPQRLPRRIAIAHPLPVTARAPQDIPSEPLDECLLCGQDTKPALLDVDGFCPRCIEEGP